MQSKDTELKPLTIKHGTLAEWEDSDKNPDDIVFLTDVEEIRAHGKSYGGDKIWKLNKETGGIHTQYSVEDYTERLYWSTNNDEIFWSCYDRGGNPIEFEKDQIIQLKDSDGAVLEVTILDVVVFPWSSMTYYRVSPQLDTTKTYTYGPYKSEVTNQANGYASVAEGFNTKAEGDCSHSEGCYTKAEGDYSHTEGSTTTGVGYASHAEGNNTIASGYSSHSEGGYTKAIGSDSHAEGNSTIALGETSHTEGQNTISYGSNSHAEGILSYDIIIDMNDYYDWSVGVNTIYAKYTYRALSGIIKIYLKDGSTIYVRSTVEQDSNAMNLDQKLTFTKSDVSGMRKIPGGAIGEASHTEGIDTCAEGDYSHAEGCSGTTGVGYGSHAEGGSTKASGYYSHSEGSETVASGSSSHAEGNRTVASGEYSHAEGYDTTASGYGSHAEGNYTTASKDYSHAEGSASTGCGNYSHAEGQGTNAGGVGSHAEGYDTTAAGNYSHAEGMQDGSNRSLNLSYYSWSIGSNTIKVSNDNGVESGVILMYYDGEPHYFVSRGDVATRTMTLDKPIYAYKSQVTNMYKIYGVAVGQASHTEGCNTTASGPYSHAEGWLTESFGRASHAEGKGTYAYGENSHAEGGESTAEGDYSHVEGSGTTGTGYCSHAEGIYSKAIGRASHTEGEGTKAQSYTSHAEGQGTTASGEASHSEGRGTEAEGYRSHAEGDYTKASGSAAHAEGHYTKASGSYSHAEGDYTKASGSAAHAQGYYTTAYGDNSHSEGRGDYSWLRQYTWELKSKTIVFESAPSSIKIGSILQIGSDDKCIFVKVIDISEDGLTITVDKSISLEHSDLRIVYGVAYGDNSHSEGYETIATGNSSHAEGEYSEAKGNCSHAEGYSTITTKHGEHAEGIFNKSNDNTLSSIGIGTSDKDRKNAQEVMQNGDFYVIGIGGYDGTNPKEATRLQDVVAEHPKVQNELTYSDDGQTLTSHPLLYKEMFVVDTEEDYNKCTEVLLGSTSQILEDWTAYGSDSTNNGYWGYCNSIKEGDSIVKDVTTIGGKLWGDVPCFSLNSLPQDYIFNCENTTTNTGFIDPQKYNEYDICIAVGTFDKKVNGGHDYLGTLLAINHSSLKNAFGIALHSLNLGPDTDGIYWSRPNTSEGIPSNSHSGYTHIGSTIQITAFTQGDLNSEDDYKSQANNIPLLSLKEGMDIVKLQNPSGNVYDDSYCIKTNIIRDKNVFTLYFSTPYLTWIGNTPNTDDNQPLMKDLPLVIDLDKYSLTYHYKNADGTINKVEKIFKVENNPTWTNTKDETVSYTEEQIVKVQNIFDHLKGVAHKGFESKSTQNGFFRYASKSNDNKIINVHSGNYHIEAFDPAEGTFKKVADDSIPNQLKNGSRLAYNKITKKLFYFDGYNFVHIGTIQDDNISKIENKVSLLESAVNNLGGSVNRIESTVNTLGTSVNTIESKTNTIESTVNTLGTTVNNISNQVSNSVLPKGTVIDWYGDASFDNIPYGWVPCGGFFKTDGGKSGTPATIITEQNKWKQKYPNLESEIILHYDVDDSYLRITKIGDMLIPNLSGRFIVSAGYDGDNSTRYQNGDTGGENSHKLTAKESGLPAHTHTASGYWTRGTGGSGDYPSVLNYDTVKSNIPVNVTVNSVSGTGAAKAHENRPPYYALWKLIKVI